MITLKIESGFKDESMIFIDKKYINNDQDLFITELGFYPNARFHYKTRKGGAQQFIIIVCLKGSGIILINKKKHVINKNEVAIIPKGIPHKYWAVEDDPWSIHWAHFDGDYIFNSCPHLKEFAHKKMDELQATSIAGVFVNMIEYLNISINQSLVNHSFLSLKYILSTIFVEFDGHSLNKDNVVDIAIAFMKSNVNKNLSLSEVSKECSISKSQLSLLFTKQTGYSPINYFLRLKCDLAVKYLLLTDLSVKEISYLLGIKDQYYFSRFFKKIKYISPLKFRKTNSID